MAFCANCGSEVEPGSAFCGSCGAAAPGAESPASPAAAAPPPAQPTIATPPTPPPAAGPPAYGPPAAPAPPAGYAKAPKGGGGGKVALFSILGVLVIGLIVVLIGGFAWPGWFTGGDSAADVEKVVQDFYGAMQKGDAKAMVKLLDPSSIKELDDYAEEYGYDDGEELLQEYIDYAFPENDLKITGLKYETTIKGDKATVEVVGGKATYTDYYGDEVEESYDDNGEVFSDEPFDLKKIDGKWYLMPEFDL